MNRNTALHGLASTAVVLCMAAGAASADQLFVDDVIVQGSLCVGMDCTNGESFGFDTLRLKENNLRINFDDTSTSASFPSNDWRLIVNDSSNGGLNRFSIEDTTAGRNPFTVEAGAQANTLYVQSDGDVGVKTSNPLVDIHVVEGNTPTLRLEQDGSDGFAPHIWDMAGNETNFFVRNVTSASALPLRIFQNASNNNLVLRNRRVGINEETPDVALEIRNPDGVGALNIFDTGGSGPLRMVNLENNGAVQLLMTNSNNNAKWMFSSGRNLLFVPSDDTGDAVFDLSDTGNLTIDGTLTESSDKRRKTAIEPVDPQAILDKVADMPVAEWTYIHDAADGIRHIGPMAQDFHAAFGVGRDETGISSLDGTGVALAAIQALTERNAALRVDLDAALAAIDALRDAR